MTRTQLRLLRFFPSLTDVAFIIPMLFLFTRMRGVSDILGDGDTGWHLRTGEWILANGRIPSVDLFSFTKPGERWYAWEWLWDLLFGWVHLHFGLDAVAVLNIGIICLTFALLYRLVRRRCENPLIAIGCTALAAAGSTIHWLARPHLVTMLAIVLVLMVLDRTRDGSMRALLLLPPLTVLWTNLHGGFLAGIIILGMCAAAYCLAAILEADANRRAESMRKFRAYAATAAACGVASLVNPYTWHLHRHIFYYLREPFLFTNIQEFQSFNFQSPTAVYLEISLALGLVASFWFSRRGMFAPLVLFLGWGHMAIFSARNTPLFMILAAPWISEFLDHALRTAGSLDIPSWIRDRLLGPIREIGTEVAALEAVPRVHVTSFLVLVTLLGMVGESSQVERLRAGFNPELFPVRAAEQLSEVGASRTLSTDQWSDYLIYRFPERKVFIDGRSDFYGADFDRKYLDVLNGGFEWQAHLERHSIDTVMLSPKIPVVAALKESPRWRVAYDDGEAIIFRANQADPSSVVQTTRKNPESSPRTLAGQADQAKTTN